ncbi:hypothetical protein ACH4GE_29505 [Streptomyces tendae]|uniref:Uncharacterized protein n=1 Tax=Streptomyces tendae TaxID=1932 RepID=A0A6B3QC98_STRTE|nr:MULTISPECIES: hypothetical protein [unclassified Streptomyces]MBQ0963848.1 hypothetical protein [Streptomyces sp. RK74B]MBQ1004200.1 hypothetical protein [Streptomyces sp. RK23]NEV85946.1 hypothetical protein [Streptomyces tendae]BET45800.1 hypothetical protein RGQ21_07820 [Kitasatospora aureofaciens]
MQSRRTLLAVAEVAAWWVPLAALWLVLVSTVDPLEVAVGAGASAVVALVARGARRAVTGR